MYKAAVLLLSTLLLGCSDKEATIVKGHVYGAPFEERIETICIARITKGHDDDGNKIETPVYGNQFYTFTNTKVKVTWSDGNQTEEVIPLKVKKTPCE